jgi:hypothetical protein
MTSKTKDRDGREAEQAGAGAEEQDRLLDALREERIRRRAYEMYLKRGAEPGLELEDWLQAERELTNSQPELPTE